MNETILVVDDELSSRTFARDALQACGYTVVDTDEPQEALQIMRDQPVQLLVVDVVMPDWFSGQAGSAQFTLTVSSLKPEAAW